jgi:hypothetical protein
MTSISELIAGGANDQSPGEVVAVVQTPKPKSNSVVTTKYDAIKRQLTFTVAKAGELVLDLGAISQGNADYAMVHGFKARVVDAAAMPFNAKEKRYATASEKYEAMAALVSHYNSGAEGWSPKRAERVGSDELMLTRALSEAFPDKTAEYVRAKVAGWTKAERLVMMESPKLKVIIERMRAETLATTGVDADKLLGSFIDEG